MGAAAEFCAASPLPDIRRVSTTYLPSILHGHFSINLLHHRSSSSSFKLAVCRTQSPKPDRNYPLGTVKPYKKSPNCTLRQVEPAFSGEDEEVEGGRGEIEDFEVDDDDIYSVDYEELEEEAQDVVREFSMSLSQELSIEMEINEQPKTGGKQKRPKSFVKHIPDHLLPRLAIVGRPNVGKSALFNRLVGRNMAIVVDEPGVTRDRLYARSLWGEKEFMVIDTGGVITVSKSQAGVMEELAITNTIGMDNIPLASREAAIARMPSMIERQAAAATDEASVIIFLVDGQIWWILENSACWN